MMTLDADTTGVGNRRGADDRQGATNGLGTLRHTGSGDLKIRTVTFASCYVYSPSGPDTTSARSRLLRAMLKAGDARFIVKYAFRVREQAAGAAPLAGFFDASVLIPIPGSVPARSGFVSEQLALALQGEGLGESIWPGLHRVRAVRKSATAAPGSRPSVANHYDSFAVDPAPLLMRRIMLIDDVVTKGRTLLAAAARLHEAFPAADIRGFAMLRTMGLASGVERLLEPCVGEIKWSGGDARRNP